VERDWHGGLRMLAEFGVAEATWQCAFTGFRGLQ